MPLESFEGKTFVAYIDISGFKDLMRNENDAWKALDKFYNAGYIVLGVHRYETIKVDGLLVSDCGILFVRRENQSILNSIESLKAILSVVREINKKMIRDNFMLTTSIAYGKFNYQERIEFPGIEKHPIYGNAYVSAFLNNENGEPKIQPGQCRILKRNLPSLIKNTIEENNSDEIFKLIKERNGDNKHFYYYWMLNSPHHISEFECRYSNAFKLPYEEILRALKGN